MQQGDPLVSAGFCISIHPEICALDAHMQRHGGFAKFDMDDGYIVGPAAAAFEGVRLFGDAILSIGLDLQVHKCKCFSPSFNLHSCTARSADLEIGSLHTTINETVYGLVVGGTPIGESRYVHAFMECKTTDMMSKFERISSKLLDRHLQSLHAITYFSMMSAFLY